MNVCIRHEICLKSAYCTFQLGRNRPGGDAIALLYVDEPVSEEVLDKVRAFPEIISAKPLQFDIG